MQFKKEERSCHTPPGWRLATVKEATQHVESIKSQEVLEEWDRARLLDGWIGGSGYEFKAHVGFRSCVGYMLLVQCPQQAVGEIVEPDNMVNCPYSYLLDEEGRNLVGEKGMSDALFLCSEDWNYDVLCFLFNYWSKSNDIKIKILKDNQKIKDTSYGLNKLARDLQNTRKMKREPKAKFSLASMRAMLCDIFKCVPEDFFENKLDDFMFEEIADSICKQRKVTNDLAARSFHFDTTDALIWEAVANIVWSFAADSLAIGIIRNRTEEKNKNIYGEIIKGERMEDLALVSSIVVNVDRLLNKKFSEYNSLGEELEKRTKDAGGDFRLFGEMLRDQSIFRYEGQHVLNTILVQAAKEGQMELLKRLLEWGVKPLDTDDKKHKTALHHAAKFEDEELAIAISKELLKGPSSETLANAEDYKKRTPLHRAALCGHAKVCRLLLDHKASVFSTDEGGRIPLHWGFHSGNEEVIRVLISGGAESIDRKDVEEETPLDLAVQFDEDIDMVAWLLSLSSQPEAYFAKLEDLALYLRESSERGYEELVRKLLNARANPLEKDQEGKTALHYAVECKNESQALNIVRELNKHDRELVKACDKYGRSVLHIAAFVGHEKVCRWLLTKDGVDLDMKDRDGQNALYYAAAGTHDDDEVLECLIYGGYRMRSTNIVDLKDSSGTTLLHVAAANGKIKMVRRLLSRRLIPKEQDKKKFVGAADVMGQTALHKATSGGHRKVVQILLENGAHPLKERDSDGKTALHYAAQAEKSGNGEDALKVGISLLENCNHEEKYLLLFASAAGIGSADQSLESQNSKLKEYLVKEKDKIKKDFQKDNNLLRVAATLGNIDMTRELLARGANIADIRSEEWIKNLKDKQRQNSRRVLEQIDNIVEQGTDKPALQDNLGRIGFANGLAALFLNPYVKSPITVGISGEWGMGKSSVMAQTESILLKSSAYVTFSNSLQPETFPGAKISKLSRDGKKKRNKIKNSIKKLQEKSSKQSSRVDKIIEHFSSMLSRVTKIIMHSSSTPVEESDSSSTTTPTPVEESDSSSTPTQESDPLNEFLNICKPYQPQYEKIYKSMAAMDRKNLFEYQEGEEEGTIPSILTVRYNAWEYRNENEAWAGLAVEITKELEAAMPVAQKLYNSWRYNWKYNKYRIWRDGIFPCLVVVILALWFSIIVWFLLDRASSKKFNDFKYGSFPITFVAIVWAAVKSVIPVVNSVSSQMIDYLSITNHSAQLGYQKKVIKDIKFLKDEALSHRPSKLWRVFAWIWCIITFSWDERYVHSETRMPKMTPASKDQLRMVVFVDDLDRCEENVILKILSAINLVLAVCKIDVILGMDKSMIERAVRRKFKDKNNNLSEDLADKYLKKIVQLPLDLPDPSLLEYRKFLRGNLGMSDTSENDANPAPKEKEKKKKNPKYRIGRRNPNPGTDTTGGADSHLSDTTGESDKKEQRDTTGESDKKEKPDKTGESSQCLQKQESHIVIDPTPGVHTEESSNLGAKPVTGVPTSDKGFMTCFRKWRSYLFSLNKYRSYLSSLYKCEDNPQSKQRPGTEKKDQGKEEPIHENNIPIEMIIPKYTEGERKAFEDLQTETTGSRKLPREWKRLLNYHRLAWNILSKKPNVAKLDGWQVQLIAWIFVCWEWKDQINILIQKWQKLDVLTNWVTHHQQGEEESSGPSLREIVEEYMDGRWKGDSDRDGVKGNSPKPGQEKASATDIHESSPPEKATTILNYIKRVVRDVVKQDVKQDREQEQEHSLKIKEVEGREMEELEDCLKTVIRKVLQEEIRNVLAEKEQEGHLNFTEKECEKDKRIVSEDTTEENSFKQEKTSHTLEGKGKEAEEGDKEKEQWQRLKKTLTKYNVSMDGIQAFQNFRFHCVAGYLPWPLPEE